MRIVTIVLMLCVSAARADEYYEFYRINCVKEISSLEVEHVGYSNISYAVWPEHATGEEGWKDHVGLLKQLERGGLYVFDQWYGYYEEPTLARVCGDFMISVQWTKALREEGPVGSRAPVRMGSRLSISHAGKTMILALPLDQLRVLRVYKDWEKLPVIDICTKAGCGNYAFGFSGALDEEKLSRFTRPR